MTTAQEYFMAVVREKSISRAAEKLYLTQQNMSNHIRRLEEEYGVLFHRKPKFELTPAGEALYHTLQQIQVLERGLDTRIRELKQEQSGTLRLGIHPSRARVILPQVLCEYREQFPHVRVELFLQETETNRQMLRNGQLDLFLGVDPPAMSEFEYIPLQKEPIYFVSTLSQLREQCVFPENNTIPMEALPRFRYLLNPPISHLRQKINDFLKKNGLAVQEAMRIGDFELQLMLCAQGEGVCFCTQMMLPKIHQLNLDLPLEQELHAFQVEGLAATNEISLVLHRLGYRSNILNGFIAAFQNVLANEKSLSASNTD